MQTDLHGQTCTIVLFEEPGGELQSLAMMVGVLEVGPDGVKLRDAESSDAVRIPAHLLEDIESVTDEHRECIEELVSTYCLRVFYDGWLNRDRCDLDAILPSCSGPSSHSE